MTTPFGLESVLSMPRFRATDLLNLRTPDALLKSKNLLILSFPNLLHSVQVPYIYINNKYIPETLKFFLLQYGKME
jgi:hypothetical protein